MTLKERMEKAEREVKMVKALDFVYKNITDKYNSLYRTPKTDDDGNWIRDEKDELIYEDVKTDERPMYCFDYDDELYDMTKDIFQELFHKLENWK